MISMIEISGFKARFNKHLVDKCRAARHLETTFGPNTDR